MFLQSCFIRKNTPELRKELEKLGYTMSHFYDDLIEPTVLVASHNSKVGVYLRCPIENVLEGTIDCGENEDMFLALAALRDDSDMNQWCICIREHLATPTLNEIKIGEWKLNIYVNKLRKCSSWRKATAEEIIKHFNHYDD